RDGSIPPRRESFFPAIVSENCATHERPASHLASWSDSPARNVLHLRTRAADEWARFRTVCRSLLGSCRDFQTLWTTPSYYSVRARGGICGEFSRWLASRDSHVREAWPP